MYALWRRAVSSWAAAAVAVVTIFFAYQEIDWIYYEHITAALFLPWWLHFIEGINRPRQVSWRWWLAGAMIGGLLFMTYYYWFFVGGLASLAMILIEWRTASGDRKSLWNALRSRIVITAGAAIVASPYWLPLLFSLLSQGMQSAQNAWFGLRHADLASAYGTNWLETLIALAGVFGLGVLWNRRRCRSLIAFFVAALVMLLLDRLMNVAGASLQTRKILELGHVFAAAPAGLLVAFLASRSYQASWAKSGLLALVCLLTLLAANRHTEIRHDPKYEIGINQRVPKADLAVLSSVETRHRIFLTNYYIGCCYLPYYIFIHPNNMTAHPASQYDRRVDFLEASAAIEEPELLAYVLTHNRYDPIDYVYLPLNDTTGRFELSLALTYFNRGATTKLIQFNADHTVVPSVFVPRHRRGLFELNPVPRTKATDERIIEACPECYSHLAPLDSVNER